MKTMLSILLPVILLSGCGKPDPKIATIESRMTIMESNLNDVVRRQNNASNVMQSQMEIDQTIYTNLESVGVKQVIEDAEYKINAYDIADIRTIITNLSHTISGRPIVRTQHVPSPVPEDVMDQIRADAEKEFPNDYDEQLYIINQQVQAWVKLHP